ncbi:MAG TPA: dipeptidase [Novosphingobium sp.]|nr:dipeptidase [Novosphingobium sp.]
MRRILLLAGAATLIAAGPSAAKTPEQIAADALRAAPVWDGHNDVPEQLRERRKDVLGSFDFRDTSNTAEPAKDRKAMQTDLARLRRGHVGAQFWSVYVDASLPEPQAVQATLEQIDVMKRLIARNPADMQFVQSAAEAELAMRSGKIASLLGIEGGHSIGGSLGVLRQMHALGARYMTLTHFNTLAWADSATDAPKHDGLTDFGRDVVREMQRLGMLVDLSHVSEATMMDALDVAKAPVIFSHSGAGAIDNHPRNVSDAVLDRVKANGGIVMVVSAPAYVNAEVRDWNARKAGEEARLKAINTGFPDRAKAQLAAWVTANASPRATLAQLADHIGHIKQRIGVDHIGLGGDFDGIGDTTEGFGDVAAYPALFAELARRGYSQADLQKISSGNMLRVMRASDAYAAAHRVDPPIESPTTF